MVAHRVKARGQNPAYRPSGIFLRLALVPCQAYRAEMARRRDSKHSWLIAFVVLALAVRMIIPAGWMPSMVGGKSTITLCTGAGMVEAWVDADGKIHKENPAKKGASDQPCAFAGLSGAADAPQLAHVVVPLLFAPQSSSHFDATNLAVGLGLAAPPPPAIGPPTLI
jgi:hypothetical protein